MVTRSRHRPQPQIRRREYKLEGQQETYHSPSLFKMKPRVDSGGPSHADNSGVSCSWIRDRKGRQESAQLLQLHLCNILSTPGDAGPGSSFLLEISGAAFGVQEGL